MQKRRHVGHEIRHHRGKRQDTKWNEEQNHIPSSYILTASARFEQDRDITTDERKRGATSLRSSRLLQDETVQKWLEQTATETDSDRRHKGSQRIVLRGSMREIESVKLPRAREHDLSIEHEKARGRPGKRKLDFSSDSSFLEHTITSDRRPENLLRGNAVEELEIKQNLEAGHLFPRREISVGSEGSVVSLSIKTRDDSFDKRKRRKTKLDRYEPKEALVDPISRIDKGDKTAKVRRSQSRRKLRRSTTSHLMHQFASEKVGHDRLTMRPRLTAGLFKNGRSSSPMRRRGLPDLAFSEMDFLRRPKQRSVEIENNLSFFRSREKDRRRSERGHNEISRYFKPYTDSCNEIERHHTESAGKVSKPNCKSKLDIAKVNNNHSRPLKSIEESIESSTKPCVDQDHRHVSERLSFGPHLHMQSIRSSVASDKILVDSHREESCYTWSDSGYSPRMSQRNQEVYSAASSTPEQVRIMMDQTGIFKGTGIDRTTARMHDTNHERHTKSKLPKTTSDLSNTRISDFSTTNTRKATYANIKNKAHIGKREDTTRDQPSPRASKSGSLNGNNNASRDDDIPCTAKSIIHHSGQIPKASEYSDRKDTSSQIEYPQRSLSRHEIAQKAYITHSTTTSIAVPVIESLERSLISGETNEQIISIRHKTPTKQIVSGELNAETYQLLGVGPNETREGRCIIVSDEISETGDFTISKAPQHQPLEASSISVTRADQRDQTMQLADEQRVPCCTPEVKNVVASTHPDEDSSLNHVVLSNMGQETRASLPKPIYERLPLRGSWPDQFRSPISHPDSNLPRRSGPLYSRYTYNDMSYSLGDRSHGHSTVQNQWLHSHDTLLNIQNDGDNQGALGGNYDLFSDAESMQENHIVVSNDEECVAVESLQEKEPDLRTNHDILPLAARREHGFYEYSYAATSPNQQCLSAPGSTLSWERDHLHFPHNLVQGLAGAGDLVESYALRRFWQPRHQY